MKPKSGEKKIVGILKIKKMRITMNLQKLYSKHHGTNLLDLPLVDGNFCHFLTTVFACEFTTYFVVILPWLNDLVI